MELLLVVLGAIVGALATGGVGAWDAWRQRQERRRVAARVILGDLFVLEAALEVILRSHRWPDRLDLQAMVDTWRDVREAFALGVKAWEWALVDGVFSNLHRTALMVRLGEPCSHGDKDVLAELSGRIPRARDVVMEHSTFGRERDEVMKQLSSKGRAASSSG
jgi:hypothetical protein